MAKHHRAQFTADDEALFAELGIEEEVKQTPARTPREERIIAGFEEIRRFVEQTGRLPSMAEGNDIFERIYATRLEQIRRRQECRDVLAGLDPQGLLEGAAPDRDQHTEAMSDDALLAELGVDARADTDVTHLRHVKSQTEKKAAEDIANRTTCEDFDSFKPVFDAVRQALDSGMRETRKFRKDAGFLKTDIEKGQFFILRGQIAYIAEVGECFAAPNGETDARLRVIYANGTESDLLLRSMQRALYKDAASRVIPEPDAGPLFSGTVAREDTSSGIIYVLRSKSDDPRLKQHRDILHKIGVTGENVEKRIANAARDPTFLLADVEIVATYELFNINRTRLENLIHKFFEPARLDVQIKDRFGQPVMPREWFLVPRFAIDDAVGKIKDGTIGDYFYDPKKAALSKRA